MSDTGTISQELINKVAEELAQLKAERDELRECVALASHMMRRIGTVDANSVDNIRRAEKWLELARAVLAKGKG